MSRQSRNHRAAQQRHFSALFAALGDDTRLSLIGELAAGGSRSIAQLSAGRSVSRQAVTKHLQVLSSVGLVEFERSGRESRYALRIEPLVEVGTYLSTISRQWNDATARLKGKTD